MPIIEFSQRDIDKSKVVEPGYYVIRIDSATQATAKSGTSTNYPMEGTIIKNADNGDKKFEGVPVQWWFNSGAAGIMIPFFAAFGIDIKAGARADLNAMASKEVEVFIGNDLYDGRVVNKVTNQWRALQDKNK